VLHTLIVSYMHKAEATVTKRLFPQTKAPHAEQDIAHVFMYYQNEASIVKAFLSNVADANFVLVSSASINLPSIMVHAIACGANLFHEAALSAASKGNLECLQLALSHFKDVSSINLGTYLLASLRSSNETGSIACLDFLQYSFLPDQMISILDGRAPGYDKIWTRGARLSSQYQCIAHAALSGSIKKLRREYQDERKYPIAFWSLLPDRAFESFLVAAASNGHLNCLQELSGLDSGYARSHVSYGMIAAIASGNGHYECAKWAYSIGMRHGWNCFETRSFLEATANGHVECALLAIETTKNQENSRPHRIDVNELFESVNHLLRSDTIITIYKRLNLVLDPKTAKDNIIDNIWLWRYSSEKTRVERIRALFQLYHSQNDANTLLLQAAKFGWLESMNALKDVGATNFTDALKVATTGAAALLNSWLA